MTEAQKTTLARLNVVAHALAEASEAAWSRGKLNEARALYLRREVAESRARDYELAGIAEELGKKIVIQTFGGGAHLI